MTCPEPILYVCSSCSKNEMAVKEKKRHTGGHITRKIVCLGCGHITHTIEVETKIPLAKFASIISRKE